MGPIDESSDLVLSAGEIDQFCESIPNHERLKFWNLVNQIEQELSDISKVQQTHGKIH